MKKTICILLITAIALKGFPQTIDSSLNAKKQALLIKSQNQKTAAIALGAVGSVAMIAGIAGLSKETLEEGFGETEGGKGGGATALLIGGTISMGAGAFLAIESGKNKKKAAQITTGIIWEKTTPLAMNKNLPVNYPAIAIQLRLNQDRAKSLNVLQR